MIEWRDDESMYAYLSRRATLATLGEDPTRAQGADSGGEEPDPL